MANHTDREPMKHSKKELPEDGLLGGPAQVANRVGVLESADGAH